MSLKLKLMLFNFLKLVFFVLLQSLNWEDDSLIFI